jgi:TRAP-type C4-dicarboxylate transport system permease small subunit
MFIILFTIAFHWTLTHGTLNFHTLYVEIPLVYYLATVIATYEIAIFRMLSPMPCVTFRNVLAVYGAELFAPLPTPILEVRPL